MTNPTHPVIDLPEVRTRNIIARGIVGGFSASLPALAEMWRAIEAALADTDALTEEHKRMAAELWDLRMSCANLLAASRATLTANRDGEPDPLFYLRDELSVQGHLPRGIGRHA